MLFIAITIKVHGSEIGVRCCGDTGRLLVRLALIRRDFMSICGLLIERVLPFLNTLIASSHLVILILALNLFIEQASRLWWQIVNSLDLLPWVIVQMVLNEVFRRHAIDLQCLVSIEREVAQSEESEKVLSVS